MPEGEHVVPLGQARLAREGDDVTLVAYGAMVPLCERAADALEGEASVEVLDLRTLKPLDEDALLASAAKTGRVVIVQEAPRTAGFGAELAAILAEKAILDLRGPVLRVTGYDVPYPYWKIEDAYMPSVERVVRAVRQAPRVLSRGCGVVARARRVGLLAAGRVRLGTRMKWDDPRIRVVQARRRVVSSRRAAGRRVRARAAPRARAGAGERARSERRRRLGRRAARAGRLRPGRGRAGAPRRRAGRLAVGVPRRGRARIGLRVLLAPADAWIQEPRTLQGLSVLHARYAPVAAIDPGGRSRFQRSERAGGSGMPTSSRSGPEGSRGHALDGPVEVRGARAGQTLVVQHRRGRPA